MSSISKEWSKTKRAESRDSNRYFCTHVHSNIIHKPQKVDITQETINRGMDEQNVVHSYSGILFSLKTKEILTHATTWMNLEEIRLGEIKPDRNEQILSNSIYMKCLK
jgi:hypothetical protein